MSKYNYNYVGITLPNHLKSDIEKFKKTVKQDNRYLTISRFFYFKMLEYLEEMEQ